MIAILNSTADMSAPTTKPQCQWSVNKSLDTLCSWASCWNLAIEVLLSLNNRCDGPGSEVHSVPHISWDPADCLPPFRDMCLICISSCLENKVPLQTTSSLLPWLHKGLGLKTRVELAWGLESLLKDCQAEFVCSAEGRLYTPRYSSGAGTFVDVFKTTQYPKTSRIVWNLGRESSQRPSNNPYPKTENLHPANLKPHMII